MDIFTHSKQTNLQNTPPLQIPTAWLFFWPQLSLGSQTQTWKVASSLMSSPHSHPNYLLKLNWIMLFLYLATFDITFLPSE